jgi:hypothetical protein
MKFKFGFRRPAIPYFSGFGYVTPKFLGSGAPVKLKLLGSIGVRPNFLEYDILCQTQLTWIWHPY